MHKSDHLLDKMRKKGWSAEEIEHARIIFSEHKLHHHIFPPIIDLAIHWLVIFSIILANGCAFFFMLPLIIITDNPLSYLLIGILGIALGSAFKVVLNDLSHMEKHHHFFISMLVPLISITLFLLSMYILQRHSNTTINPFRHPLIYSFVYTGSFMLPYYSGQIAKKFRR